jgi:hypothetical protein
MTDQNEYRELVKLMRQAVENGHFRAPGTAFGQRLMRTLERAGRELDPPASGYPEHDKLTKVSDRTQAVGDFADWCGEKGYRLMSYLDKSWTEFEDCGECWHSTDSARQRCAEQKRCEHCAGTHRVQVTRREQGWFNAPPTTDLLAKWAGIDQAALESEKRAMLDTLRARQVSA